MASDNLPTPQSYEQILSDSLKSYAAKVGIDDFNVGSAVTSFFEVVALIAARSSGDIFQILKDFSVDRATGDALRRLAAENNVSLLTAKSATGYVTVTDTSFSKISTKIYAGANPPNIGSTSIKVSDASLMPPTGSLYIGRGTPNTEGPIAYSSIVQTGGYYTINLSSPTTKFHNIGENVILAQGGNRSITVNTVVTSPAIGANPDIQFSVTTAAVILDGETVVENVPVSALVPGSAGNIPRGAIKQFTSPPFSGASVSNPLPFTTGSDNETDDQLRIRIKRALASIGLGTATAIKSAVIGATPSDEQATVISDELQLTNTGAVLYIDDGNGYEEKTKGVGLESIVDNAIGGESFFQLATGGRQAPVAKALLESTIAGPYDLIGGDTLSIIVGEQTFEHVFANSDFRSPGGATAYEVTASINANTSIGFEAITAEGGQYVIVRAKEEGNDSLKITTPTTSGRDASILLGFPSNEVQTLRLYKNKNPLSKDGKTASVFTQSQQLWSASIANGDTLVLSIDGTANITYTVLDADFISEGTYVSVSPSNSLESWVNVFNSKLTGVTAAVIGQQIRLTSNLGISNRAHIVIDPSSTLVTKGMFSSSLGLDVQGKSSDFILSRNTAQFQLTEPLVAGDQLSGGSLETEARIESSKIASGSVTLASDAHIWILIDALGSIIPTGLVGNALLTVSKPSSNVIRYGCSIPNCFSNVQVGDYLIAWSEELDPTNRLEGRVNAVTSTSIDILITSSEYAAAVVSAGVFYFEGFVVLRSTLAPQKFKVLAGTKTLEQIASEMQTQTQELIFSVLDDQYLVIRTKTKDVDGKILVVTSDSSGQSLLINSGLSDVSQESLIAFLESNEQEASFPLFIHSKFASENIANPIDSYINSFTSAISLSGRDPNELISILQPYGSAKDAQPYGETVQESSISGSTIGIVNQSLIRRLRQIDRFFIANPLDFGHEDSMVTILDNDTNSKSFQIPFFRRALTNTTLLNNASNFNAYDVDSGNNVSFSSYFPSFDFSNFKVLMQAKKVLKHTNAQTALLYRSVNWGRSGEKINIGYIYPSSANAIISSAISIDSSIDIRINLKSGASVPSSIDASTEWNITVTPNTPIAGVDQVTYTWNGTGSAPALALSGGEYVNISSQTEFNVNNTGIFRVSTQAGFTPTATSFSVQRPTGIAVSESNKSTQVNGSIIFYQSSSTTAADINSYVNSQLSNYVSSTIVNDGGNSGSGVIDKSTFEDSNFQYESVYLKDGINWILSSNVNSSPEFTFKKPLDLPSDVGYAFNASEEIRLIPTTIDQVRRLISILAVTGFTTVGGVNLADRGTRLELETDILGSDGSIQIIGGLANGYSIPVLDSAIRLDNTYSAISVSTVASQGAHSDQWFKLSASVAQKKEALLSSNSSVTVLANSPSVGNATIKLLGRTYTQRYFGAPRHNIRSKSNTFKIEKQGSLICLSWNGVGSSPNFFKNSLNFNDSLGGTLNVNKVSGSSDVEYRILTGNANFTELSIGDLITISGMSQSVNNGTFLVTGVSSNGRIVRVANPNAVNEYSSGTFTFTGNSTAGDSFTINGTTLVAGTDFAIGLTQQDTAANLSAVIGTIPNVSSSVNGSIVTVTATFTDASFAISYSGSAVVNVSGSNVVGPSFVAGNFAASSGVSEGDSIILSSPFAILNQGTFRVIRRYNDSVWFENENAIEEEVTLPLNNISLGFDNTTSFKVNATNYSAYVNWNGVGTEPTLGNAKVGDIITFGSDFSSGNIGDFMVIRSGSKLQEITQLVMPSGPQFTVGGAGKYFLINSAGDVNQYYVWFNVNGSNSDPSIFGKVGLQVNILSGDTATLVAAKAAAVITVATGLTASSSNDVVTVTTTGFIETTDASNVNMPSPFSATVTQQGQRTFLECINPSAVNQSAVFINNVFICHRPQMQYFEYEASVPGDQFVVTGDTLGASNAGSYNIIEIINKDTAVISGNLSNISNSSLNGRESSVYVQEGKPYTGYKRIYFVSPQPGSLNRNYIVFDTNAQYSKINESASVELLSVGKMNYSIITRKGLDSYRYNTGLIAEANRIVYGDPRDSTTYPGVGAAGAEIFIRGPLVKRIQISVVVRLKTGVPFAQTSEQVKNSISSLVNSNPVGQSISFSSIVSVVNSIPGVQAVSISSPQYDSTHDVIVLAPSEKARIIDPTIDISVSSVG